MGAKITVEEINGKSEAEILAYKEDVIKDMKPEVKARFQERKDEITASQAAAGGAPPQAPPAAPTPPPAAAAPPQEEEKKN
jgi:hypothetical protein